MASRRFAVTSILLVLGSFALWATPECIVSCTYEQIVAPLGTAGEIGIRIQQRGTNVQSSSLAHYEIVGSGVQILDQTPWESIGVELYEKWVVVSLSEVGDGALFFRNGAVPENRDEIRILPIRVLTPLPAGRWMHAMNGLYPLDWEPAEEIRSSLGVPTFDDGLLHIGGITCVWPLAPRLIAECGSEARLFYIERNGETLPLLVVGDAFFYRCDHLLGAPSPSESRP